MLLVAIKRLEEAAEWQAEQFAAEMKLLSSVTHTSILRLVAFSTDGPQRCLVLELCFGGALNDRQSCRALAGRMSPPPLQWQHRVQLAIAIGIADALDHLHSRSPPMIHRDLKTPNGK